MLFESTDEPELSPSTRTPKLIAPKDKHLAWATLSNVESKNLPAMLLQVDYLPDDASEEEIAELFSEYGQVSGVMLSERASTKCPNNCLIEDTGQSSRVDHFFGRAFVLMATEEDARRAFVVAGKQGLVLRGEGLAVELVHHPPDASTTLFVQGLSGPYEKIERDMETLFSQFGEIRAISEHL